MNLYDIQSPKDIKNLSVKELNQLAKDIRLFLIQSIAKTGGHLASNLGTVELTIALHYVFNAPQDKIFFDVGHQSYTHKILTGRAKDFPTLHAFDGMSGFQKRSESEYDVWEAGHSSTSLSAALGMAVARDAHNEDYAVVPVIGDGALGSGMSFEALNQIGYEGRKMIIVFNDNNMSISKNVGATTMNFARLRTSNSYNKFKENLKFSLSKNGFGRNIYSGLKTMKDNIRDSLVEKGIFGEFNLDYLGPVDGHNIKDLTQAFKVAVKHDRPVVVHVITRKGKGYAPCENDREGSWHGVGPFKIENGKPLHETPEGYMPWAQLFSDTVMHLAEKNSDIYALTPAMLKGSYLQNFFAKYPDRSFDCGIAEEHAATFAAGLASANLRPYLAIYSTFLQRAYDQINHDICRMDLPVVIGIDHAGLVGGDGETHMGVFDIGILRPLPNIILAQPKDANDAVNMLYTAFQQNHPFAIRYPKGLVKIHDTFNMNSIPIGTWKKYTVSQEDKVNILTYGQSVDTLLEKLTTNHIPASVIDCRFMKPMDEDMLKALAAENKPMIIYETDMGSGGLSEAIVTWFADHRMQVVVERITIGDTYIPQGPDTRLRKFLKIDLNTVIEAVNKYL